MARSECGYCGHGLDVEERELEETWGDRCRALSVEGKVVIVACPVAVVVSARSAKNGRNKKMRSRPRRRHISL